MKLLGNFDVFKEYYNIETKRFYSFDTLQKTVGIYKIIKGKMTGLLVKDDNLYFLFGEEKFLITDSHKGLLKEKSNAEKEFNLIYRNEVVVRFSYPLPDPKLNVSPFEYIDEEDFKWGDFIANIINNQERKKNFIANLMENR